MVKREIAAATSKTTTKQQERLADVEGILREDRTPGWSTTTQKTSAAANRENFEASERSRGGRRRDFGCRRSPCEGSAIILVHRLF